MNPKLLKVIIPGVLALLLIACATPVRNVDNAPIKASSSNYDLSDVTKSIQRAGISHGWQMKEVTPGHIEGTLFIRSHVAIVDITYTLDEYSINYKDSTNVDYDPAGNTIHRNYNNWIKTLNDTINAQLSTI